MRQKNIFNSSKSPSEIVRTGDEVIQKELTNNFFRLEISTDWQDFPELSPLLFIDFDKKIFYQESLSENVDYKLYLPDGWHFHEDKHFQKIPEYLKFWIKDEVDYLTKTSEFINSNLLQ